MVAVLELLTELASIHPRSMETLVNIPDNSVSVIVIERASKLILEGGKWIEQHVL